VYVFRRLEGDDPLLSSLEGSALRRNELFVEPLLEGDIELPNVGPENGPLNNLEDERHLVPGPVVAGNPAVGIEDEELHLHAPLQQMEQEDLQGMEVNGISLKNFLLRFSAADSYYDKRS